MSLRSGWRAFAIWSGRRQSTYLTEVLLSATDAEPLIKLSGSPPVRTSATCTGAQLRSARCARWTRNTGATAAARQRRSRTFFLLSKVHFRGRVKTSRSRYTFDWPVSVFFRGIMITRWFTANGLNCERNTVIAAIIIAAQRGTTL